MCFLLVCPFSGQLSRQSETEFLRKMPSFRYEMATCCQHIRHYFLYTYGVIGLTLCCLLSPLFDATNELGSVRRSATRKAARPAASTTLGSAGATLVQAAG